MLTQLIISVAGLGVTARVGADSADVLSQDNLAAMPDAFFAELHLSRSTVLEFLERHSDSLPQLYWLYRQDVEDMGSDALNAFHAEIDRFWVMLRLRRVVSVSDFEAQFLGSMDWRIPPEEAWQLGTRDRSVDGSRWLALASLYGLGLENEATMTIPVPEAWNPDDGHAMIDKTFRAGNRTPLRQIAALENETDPKKVAIREEMRARYEDLRCRRHQDYERVTALLAPGTPTRAEFLDLFQEYHEIYGSDDPWVRAVEYRLAKNDAPGVYGALMGYLDNICGFADASLQVAWKLIRPAFRLLWPGAPFGRQASESALMRIMDHTKNYGACP